jgi:hypothetical protein
MNELPQAHRVAILVFVTVDAVDDRDAEAIARDGIHKALVDAGDADNRRLIRFLGRQREQRCVEVAAIQPLSWMMNPDLCRIAPANGPYLYREQQ